MRRGLIAVLLLAGLLAAASADAGKLRQGTNVTLGKERVVTDDLYIASETARIRGTVEGDLAAACRILDLEGSVAENFYGAAQTINLDGEVQGDAWGFAQMINIRAALHSGFRGAGQVVRVDSEVFGDVMVGAADVEIGPEAVIHGTLYVGARRLTLEGEVQGDVKGCVEEATIAGLVTGNVKLSVDELVLRPSARIQGNLVYKSEEPLEEDWSGQVGGNIIFKQLEEKGERSAWPCRLLLLASTYLFAVLLLVAFRRRCAGGLQRFREQAGSTALVGLLALLATPVAVALALVLVVTIPVALVLAAVYGILLYIGWIAAALFLGDLVLRLAGMKEPSLYLGALVGVVIGMLLAIVPYLGGIVCLVFAVGGMGMILKEAYGVLKAA